MENVWITNMENALADADNTQSAPHVSGIVNVDGALPLPFVGLFLNLVHAIKQTGLH
jgi:hypothetical protein